VRGLLHHGHPRRAHLGEPIGPRAVAPGDEAVDVLEHGPLPEPCVALLVSGGHSSLLLVQDVTKTLQPLGQTVDGLVQNTAATIFVGNVPDLRAVPVYAGADKTRLFAGIQAYNDAIAAIAARNPNRVKVVDLFTGSAALVSTATVSQDGFHPSDDGYQLIADRFANAMRANGIPLKA